MNDRPRAKLPNGKTNPEYTNWWRTTEKGRACVKSWNHSEGHKKSKKALYNKRYPIGKRKCVECGSEYGVDKILERGWKTIGRYGCICDLCS